MSAPLQILRLLAMGKAWTPAALAKETGLDRTSVDNAMRKLRSGRCMRSLPQAYEITPEGLADLEVREARALDAPVKSDAQTTVSSAMHRQPALQVAWRAGQ